MTFANQQRPLSLKGRVRPLGLLSEPEAKRVFYALPEGGCFQIPLPESSAIGQPKNVTDPDWHFYLGSR